jgi:hypothetical protein
MARFVLEESKACKGPQMSELLGWFLLENLVAGAGRARGV